MKTKDILKIAGLSSVLVLGNNCAANKTKYDKLADEKKEALKTEQQKQKDQQEIKEMIKEDIKQDYAVINVPGMAPIPIPKSALEKKTEKIEPTKEDVKKSWQEKLGNAKPKRPLTKKDFKDMKRNYLHPVNPLTTTAGNGTLRVNYGSTLNLLPTSIIGLDSILDKEATVYDVTDAEKGLTNILKFMENNPQIYPPKNGLVKSLKAFYKGDLMNYIKANPSDSASIELLANAVADSVIDVAKDNLIKNGNWQIKNGVYMLIDRNAEESESVGTILNVRTSENSGLLRRANGFEQLFLGNNMRSRDLKFNLIYSDVNEFNLPEAKEKIKLRMPKVENEEEKKSRGPTIPKDLELIAGGFVGGTNGIETGIKMQNGFGLLLNYAQSGNENLNSIISEPNPRTGRYWEGSKDNTGFKAIGIAFEGYKKGFILGAGVNKWFYNETNNEKLIKGTEIIKQNNSSVAKSEISGKGHVGYRFPVSKNTDLALKAKYDSKAGASVGINLYLNQNKKLRK